MSSGPRRPEDDEGELRPAVAGSAPKARSCNTRPWLVIAMNIIGMSNLSREEKHVLQTMLQWANPKTWLLWPSVKTIAVHTSRSERGVQLVIDRLVKKGWVVIVVESKGGVDSTGRPRTNTYRLVFTAQAESSLLEELAASLATVDNRATADIQPRTEQQGTAHGRWWYGARGAHKPSIQPSIEKAIKPSMSNSVENPTSQGGCMDGGGSHPDAIRRQALLRAGIRGPNLVQLVKCPTLTPEMIANEARDIRRDQSVKNPAGVLTARLAQLCDVQLAQGVGPSAKLTHVMTEINKKRADLRRQATDSLPLGCGIAQLGLGGLGRDGEPGAAAQVLGVGNPPIASPMPPKSFPPPKSMVKGPSFYADMCKQIADARGD